MTQVIRIAPQRRQIVLIANRVRVTSQEPEVLDRHRSIGQKLVQGSRSLRYSAYTAMGFVTVSAISEGDATNAASVDFATSDTAINRLNDQLVTNLADEGQ